MIKCPNCGNAGYSEPIGNIDVECKPTTKKEYGRKYPVYLRVSRYLCFECKEIFIKVSTIIRGDDVEEWYLPTMKAVGYKCTLERIKE